jgi:hypothetical protein
VGEHDGELAVPLERPLACQTLEEDAAERVDVRSGVDRTALDLLRRDVVDRADEAALPVRLETDETWRASPKSQT